MFRVNHFHDSSFYDFSRGGMCRDLGAAGLAVVCLVMGGLVTGGLAFAEKGEGKGGGKRSPDAIFQKRDLNGDGTLSFEEFEQGLPEKAAARAEKIFKRMDADGSGGISLDEFTKAMAKRKARGEKPRKNVTRSQ